MQWLRRGRRFGGHSIPITKYPKARHNHNSVINAIVLIERSDIYGEKLSEESNTKALWHPNLVGRMKSVETYSQLIEYNLKKCLPHYPSKKGKYYAIHIS